MKKFLIGMILVFGFSSLLLAGIWKNFSKYTDYKTARAMAIEADDSGNTIVSVVKYKEAADLAATYAIPELQAWQLNNEAYSLIKKFKQTKEKVLLVEAYTILTDAKAIADTLNIKELTAKIQSNIDYCSTILEVK